MNLGLIMSLCNTFSASIAWSVKPSRLVLGEERCVNSDTSTCAYEGGLNSPAPYLSLCAEGLASADSWSVWSTCGGGAEALCASVHQLPPSPAGSKQDVWGGDQVHQCIT